MENVEDFLDLSWTEEHNRLLNSQITYPCEPMSSIFIKMIYINSNLVIDKVVNKKYSLSKIENVEGSILSENLLMHIIQNNKKLGNHCYKYQGLATYFVNLEPDKIFDYAQNPLTIDFFSYKNTIGPMITGPIVVPSTLFIFHSINTIYMFFHELELVSKPKSILKKGSDNKITKRVRISSDLPLYKTNVHTKTAKK